MSVFEITGTEGALILDDTHREHWLNTVSGDMALSIPYGQMSPAQ